MHCKKNLGYFNHMGSGKTRNDGNGNGNGNGTETETNTEMEVKEMVYAAHAARCQRRRTCALIVRCIVPVARSAGCRIIWSIQSDDSEVAGPSGLGIHFVNRLSRQKAHDYHVTEYADARAHCAYVLWKLHVRLALFTPEEQECIK